MKYDAVKIKEALQKLDFNSSILELEYFLGGTNNYVIGLKYKDITWAICIYFPNTKIISDDKLKKFIRLQEVALYLTDKFREGVDIDENNRFIFDGNCFLCDSKSVKEFIKDLAEKQSFELSSELDEYDGPFLVKKGAPASETLEYNIDFKTIMLQGLSILHKRTGAVKLVDKELVTEITKEVIKKLDEKVKDPKAQGNLKEHIDKYNNKWNKEGDEETKKHIIREVLIRKDEYFNEILGNLLKENNIDIEAHKCFIHGDAHGGNFIVVQRGNKKEVHPIDIEEALGLNEAEKKHYLFDLVKFTVSAYNLSRIFGKPLEVEGLVRIYYGHFDFA